MRYQIVYDNHLRLRVRCGDYAFSKRQSYGIAAALNALSFVEKAEVNYRSGGILVTHTDGARNLVLEYIGSMSSANLPESNVPATVISDEKFRSDLCFVIGKRRWSYA